MTIFNRATFKSDVGFNKAKFNVVRFTEARFNGDARFGETIFNGEAIFAGSTFGNVALFDKATFGDVALFAEAAFKRRTHFHGATFKGDARFGKARFEGDAEFRGAIFEEEAWFGEATFEGVAQFSEARFEGDAEFSQAKFKCEAWFGEAAFRLNGSVELGEAKFTGKARFEKATFEDSAGFDGVTFGGYTQFNRATFKGVGRFNKTTFRVAGAVFGEARFKGNAEFRQATFQGVAVFGEATFEGVAQFSEATFGGDAEFSEATFKGLAEFGKTTFRRDGGAGFNEAAFQDNTHFYGATFKSDAELFSPATFGPQAGIGRATFDRGSELGGAKFKAKARFERTTFSGNVGFSDATFDGDAGFSDATFEGNVPMLGLVAPAGQLNLDRAQFTSLVRIEAEARKLTCRSGRFLGGVRFDVRSAAIYLDESDLSVASLLTGPPANDAEGKERQPSLLSLQGANVAGLAVGNVNMVDCRFAGAHNLDKLRLEADTDFGLSHAKARWERRQVIAEETAWRADRRPGRWEPPAWPDSGDQPKLLSPGAIAGLYRALRKGREDAKDEPGAADFYYGEMEMRRHDRETGGGANRWRGRASRIVLTAYWLVSGYGQRAWRSLAALAGVTALFAVAFHYIGFTTPPEPASYWTSLLYAFRSTISLTDSQVVLTAWGSFFQALLRITGPVLLGLTLLALRSRVKR